MAQLTDTLVNGDLRATGMIYGTHHGNYVVCSSAANAVKAVTIPGFVLTTGVLVRIKFTNTNTLSVSSLTLNVNGTGAKSVKFRGGDVGQLLNTVIYDFVYDGTNWEVCCGYDLTVLREGTDGELPLSSDYYICSGHSGGTTLTNSFIRRKFSTIWTWIKDLLSSDTNVNISGSASKLSTARKLAVSLSNTSTDTTFNGSADVTNIKTTGTLSVSNGGTGKTTVTAGNYLVGNGTNALTEKTPNAVGNNVLTSLATGDDNLIEGDYIIASNHNSGATDTTKFVRRTTARLWNYIKSQISSVLGLTVTNYGGNAATATTATKVSGTQVGQDSNARHLWFSTTVETQRGYIDSLMYRTDINRITANVSGYSSGLSYSNIIEHQGNEDTYPLHRIASFPDSLVTTQSKYGDNSLILHLFTKGNQTTDYGIVMITVKMQSTVDSTHAPIINISWKLRSSAISTDAVKAVCIYSGGLWHVDVFFVIQKQYQLMVFNKLGSYSVNGVGPNGGWTLYSSDDTSNPMKEVYATLSGNTNTAASWKLYNLSSYHSAGNELGDGGIVGTAMAYDPNYAGTNSISAALATKQPTLPTDSNGKYTINITGTSGRADVADKLGAGYGSNKHPVYIQSNGIPKEINTVSRTVDGSSVTYLDAQVDRAYAAVAAITAEGATINKVLDTANGDTIQVGNGNQIHITNAKHAATADSCTNALAINGYNIIVGDYLGVSNTIYLD